MTLSKIERKQLSEVVDTIDALIGINEVMPKVDQALKGGNIE